MVSGAIAVLCGFTGVALSTSNSQSDVTRSTAESTHEELVMTDTTNQA